MNKVFTVVTIVTRVALLPVVVYTISYAIGFFGISLIDFFSASNLINDPRVALIPAKATGYSLLLMPVLAFADWQCYKKYGRLARFSDLRDT